MDELLESLLEMEKEKLPESISEITDKISNINDSKLVNKIREVIFRKKGFSYSKSNPNFFDFLRQKKGDCLDFSLLYQFILSALEIKSEMMAVPFHTIVKVYERKENYLVETTDGTIEKPEFYIKSRNIHPSSIHKGVYMDRLKQNQILSIYINRKARKLIKNKEYNKALEILKYAYNSCKNIPELCCNLGYVHKQLGNLKEAKKFLAQSIELHPNFAQSHNNLGICYIKDEDFAKAEVCFRKSLILEFSISAYANLTNLMQKIGTKNVSMAF